MPTPDDFWEKVPADHYGSEASVEHLLIFPLLAALGYELHDISPKHSVVFHEGRKGRPHEADFAVFDGPTHTRETSLLVVEAKSPSEPISGAREQAESYAMWLRAPLYMLINGRSIAVWQCQLSYESELILEISVADLPKHRGRIEQLLSKASVRSYCKTLQLKTIAIHASSMRAYEQAELTRAKTHLSAVPRTLIALSGQSERFGSEHLLDKCPRGAIIVAPSGLGKTTLSTQLLAQSLSRRQEGSRSNLPFGASLPDLADSSTKLTDFLVDRVAAHCAGIARSSLMDALRADGATLLCDSYDRVNNAARRSVEIEVKSLLRDFPQAQVFVFTRPGAIPDLSLPRLLLTELDSSQQVQLAKLHEAQTGLESLLHFRWLTPFLRRLATHPLLLRLVLDAYTERAKPPRDILALFDAWLHRTLTMDEITVERQADLEVGLRVIAHATIEAPIRKIDAVGLLRRKGLPEGTLDELVRLDAVAVHGSQLEIVHEALADYLRASDLAALPSDAQAIALDAMHIKSGSMLPVMLAAALRTREGQRMLWNKIRASGLHEYLSALHYRADSSLSVLTLDEQAATHAFLTDMLDGIDVLLSQYFPAVREIVQGQLAHEPCQTLAISGVLTDSMTALRYDYSSRLPTEPRATVMMPPASRGYFRNLAASGLRADSGPLLGALDVQDAMATLISDQRMLGGPLWRNECLIGDLRYVERLTQSTLCELPLPAIRRLLEPLSGTVIKRPRGGSPRCGPIVVDRLLRFIDELLTEGEASLDIWWNKAPSGQADFTDIASHAAYVSEHFRRTQLVYREVVVASFADVASQLKHFAMLPIRYRITIVSTSHAASVSYSIYYDWWPVARWEDCGADVTFAQSPPTSMWTARIDEHRAELARLGRSAAEPSVPWFSPLPDLSGYDMTCNFDGLTSVAREVTEWLEDDLRVLFDGLRES